ncbi:tRNA 2-thiolation protein NcsA [Halosimplex salinum]|uniref:tRNA 2-thiolation protein NcsA n=1 Tax=Halosimplex salinum TaxID=1710538 RepID=UPI000F48C59C|nr:TIGR00269 family protein [Halosimplex salinum]
MDCDKCGDEAVMHAAYSGLHLCDEHFRRTVETRVRRRVREDNLVPRSATPDDPETWVVGLSGGKDSVVLTQVLHDTFEEDPRVELVALSIHEGIEGYRDESLAACEELTTDLDIRHEVVSYAEEFGVQMDDVVEDDPEGMAACAYCGVFRRDVLERYAEELGADKLFTGHNLDDEAQTALMNLFEGDVQQMASHYGASLGPFPAEDRDGNPVDEPVDPTERTRRPQDHHVPRAKPLRDVPEKEVALYAHLEDLPAHITECPHAEEAYRGEIQGLLLGMEDKHPGTRHSVMAGYEKLAALAASAFGAAEPDEYGECDECGAPTGRAVCRKCDLLDALEAV